MHRSASTVLLHCMLILRAAWFNPEGSTVGFAAALVAMCSNALSGHCPCISAAVSVPARVSKSESCWACCSSGTCVDVYICVSASAECMGGSISTYACTCVLRPFVCAHMAIDCVNGLLLW